MIGHDKDRPAPKGEKVAQRTPWRKRVLKVFLCVILAMVGSGGALVGVLVFKYNRIVGAEPGALDTKVRPGELGRRVNPFVGTGGIPWVCGHNFPGAMVPFGMVRLGPETASLLTRKRALNTSGYYYGDDQILGFSHTRLNGTGATDGGHFLIVPALQPFQPKTYRQGQYTRFSHREEIASPGYYAVNLPEIATRVELTATARVGVHRYTFSQDQPPHLLLDATNALGGRPSREGKLRVLPAANEVEGTVRTFGTFSGRYGGIKVYFVARFDQPFTSFGTWQNDAIFPNQTTAEGDGLAVDLGFDSGKGSRVVTLKLAISYVSIENARANLQAEAGAKDFDRVLAAAQQAWEDKLSLIKIQGGTEKQQTIFYTALYRVFQMPTVFNDANGDYLGFDRKVHQVSDFQYFTDLSIWDTFRTVHPLYTLLAPKAQRDMVVSLVKMLEQGGWLPRWPSGCGYSNSMLGTPADILIAESYLKGIRDFDVERAYQAMRRTALEPTPPGAAFSGRQGVEHYLQYKYCPAGLVERSVSRTLEFAWADHAISLLAEALGHREDAALFRDHARFYRNLWNTNTQYFQPRNAQGQFVEPFKPLLLTYLDRGGRLTRDYVEGSALQWRWAAPFDADGLISLFKSRDCFVEELNQFFAQSDPARARWNPGPYYWHGNEPDLPAAYLFNYAGRPDLTQKWTRWIMDHKYSDGYDGLDGNDDAGTLSAWYVFSALGFYPVAGSDKYQLGAPLFDRAEVKLKNQPLVIVTENGAPNHPYVQKVWLNDLPLDRTWISHAEIEQGGRLRFAMGEKPATIGQTPERQTNSAEAVPSVISFEDVIPDGLLKSRAELAFRRLQEEYFRWDSISRVNFGPFPGDAIGRCINGLTLLSQALHQPAPASLREIMRRCPERANSDGYLGPKLPESRANEDVLAAHNGYACGLTEYALWTKDPQATESLTRVVANLFVPAREAIACYRDQSATAAKVNWHLSGGDTGQLFLALDGMTRAYALAPTPEFKATIETAIRRYRELDLVGISAQTHSMLSATTGILRWYELHRRPEDLAFAQALYQQYRNLAMTETYENYNWFNRPEWTEGCAVSDSFILTVNLWRLTQRADYLEDAHLILFNGLLPGQLRNGGFGTGPCVGPATGACRTKQHSEAPFCCSMRGGEALARAIQYSYFLEQDTVVLPFYSDNTATLRFAAGACKVRQQTGYPHAGQVRLEVLESQVIREKRLRFFVPSWAVRNSFQISVNGKPIEPRQDNSFAEVAVRLGAGTVIEVAFQQERGPRPALHPDHTPGARRYFAGPLLLGSATADAGEPLTPILDLFAAGGNGGEPYVYFPKRESQPVAKAGAARKAPNLVETARVFRRDTPADRLPREVGRLFGELKHDRFGSICGFLWSSPQEVRQVLLQWPESAAMPRPEDVALRWSATGVFHEAALPGIIGNGRQWVYTLGKAIPGLVLDNIVLTVRAGAAKPETFGIPAVEISPP